MAIVEGIGKLKSILPRGRIGTIKGEKPTRENYAKALLRNPDAGIYQRKLTRNGKKISKMPFYWCPNPRHPKQQQWRAVFRAGKVEWDKLTENQKNEYNKRAIAKKFTGYNLFQREYLRTHKFVL
jgi:hypothetical protein